MISKTRKKSFYFSSLLFNVQGKKQTCFKEPGDIDIKKLVANALLESTNKSKNMNEQVHI